jgi:hypothetical protein
MYALVIEGEIQSVGRLPTSARRLDDGNWVMGLATASPGLIAACGYFLVLDMHPTYDSATEVLERGDVFLSDPSTPVVAYTIRPKTAEELAAEAFASTVQTNTETLSNPTSVEARIASIKGFLTDADVQVVLDQANNTALTTTQLNRALKAIVRQERRQANAWVALARLVVGTYHPEVLADIGDTSGEV